MSSFGLFCLIAIMAYVGVYILHRILRRNTLDIPNSRSMHHKPTTRGGGIAIALLTLSVGLALHLWTYALTASVIAFMGWMDDRHSLSVRFRMVIQTVCAVLIVGSFQTVGLVHLRLIRTELALVFWLPFVIVYIVYMTNIYNFMDGIDGIAGGAAVVGGIGWFFLTPEPEIQALALVLSASSLGFLAHNWSPARIFMGDVGSTFLGFSFATIALLSGDLMLGILIFWVFIFDSGFTLVRRLLHLENIFQPHKTHLYQRLVSSGYSHKTISALYIGLTVLGVLAAWMWSMKYLGGIVVVIVAAAALVIGTLVSEKMARKRQPLSTTSEK